MSRINQLSNGKSVMILGTVVGCLIILWPNIFYPMIQGGFKATNQDINSKSKIHPRMMASKVSPRSSNVQENFYGPNTHIPSIDENTIGGASVGLIMTIYTIGIIFLFFYKIVKYISSGDSLDYLNADQSHFDQEFQENVKKGESTFDKIDHKKGECLKKLAVNYVRCKSKISDKDDTPKMIYDEDNVSLAYRTLLGDMLELRDYLSELQCSINGCQLCEDEICNCSEDDDNDQIIHDQEDQFQHDFGSESDDTIDQMFDCDNIQDESETIKLDEKEQENESNQPEKDTIDDNKMENQMKRFKKRKITKEE